jgi:Domain of unknown function (DUF6458)
VSTLGPRGRPGPGPTARRRALSTGTALFLIAVGAILWFAVTANAVPGLNLHIVGVILLLIGVVGLLLPVAAGGSRTRRSLSPWLRPSGHDDPRVDELKRAAAADDAMIEEDDKFFDPDGPGSREDDL